MTLKLLKSFLKYITIFIVALIAILLCFYLYLISGSAKQGDITWHSSILTYWAMSRDVALSAPAIDYGGVEDTDEQGNTSTKAYMDACIQHTGVDMMTMLGELDRGETGEFNTQLLLSEFGEKGFSKDALSLVNCADSAPKLSRDDYIKQAKIIDNEARYDDIKERSDDYLDACYYWQWQATDDLNEKLITDNTPNLLFVAQKIRPCHTACQCR